MSQKFQKRKQKEGYDKEKEKPMIRSSKDYEERIAGFLDLQTGEFTEVLRIRNSREMDEFLETYDISVAEITKE